MTDTRHQQAFDRFVTEFLVPGWTGGGLLRLHTPLGGSSLAHFEHATCSSTEADIALRGAVLRAVARYSAPTRVSSPTKRVYAFALALHDLALLTDPELDGWPRKRAKPRIAALVRGLLRIAGPPETRTDALLRHALVETLAAAHRRDEIVRNWAATYTFYGRPVPANVVALPRLRFVRRKAIERDFLSLCATTALSPLWGALLTASPMSELLAAREVRFSPALVGVLEEPVLRSAVVRGLARSEERRDRLEEALRKLGAIAADAPGARALCLLARDLFAELLLDRDAELGTLTTRTPLLAELAYAAFRTLGFADFGTAARAAIDAFLRALAAKPPKLPLAIATLASNASPLAAPPARATMGRP